MIYFRHKKMRKYQDLMINDIYSALEEKKNIIVNAPTGIGKTDAALSSALSFALEKNLDVFFITPKISQHRIALEVLQGIKERYSLDFLFADFVGKQNMCINEEILEKDPDAFYSLCERKVKKGECRYYENYVLLERKEKELLEILKNMKDYSHISLFDIALKNNVCPYELASFIARNSRVIICDYAHILSSISFAFLKKIKKSLKSSILIFDEAHNIINRAQDYYSSTISERTIAQAKKELKKIGSSISLDFFEFMLKKLKDEKLKDCEEAFLKKEDLENVFGIDNEEACRELEERGLEYAQKFEAKKVALLKLSKFFYFWENESEEIYRMIKKEKQIKIKIKNIYPKQIKEIFESAYANVFMSATLQPIEMYKELFGVEAIKRSYPSPFPRKNKLIIVDTSATTKYEERNAEEYKKIAKRIEEIFEKIPGNVACFFPSYEVLKNVVRYLNANTLIQREGMKSKEIQRMLEELKSSKKVLLLGVMGGSLSEGIDYPENILKGIIVVGIPLEKPDLETNAKINYYEKKFGLKGRDYAYTIPAIIRAVQAAGRAIRSERDKAVIVFMDKRYRWKMYSSILSLFETQNIEEKIESIEDFWKENKEEVGSKLFEHKNP
ncbi:MAG: ATP-dependent DNA helicase [Candidatus Micrarchaeia archaeon]